MKILNWSAISNTFSPRFQSWFANFSLIIIFSSNAQVLLDKAYPYSQITKSNFKEKFRDTIYPNTTNLSLATCHVKNTSVYHSGRHAENVWFIESYMSEIYEGSTNYIWLN